MLTLSANPWLVTQREMRTPMAASFSSPTQAPVSPGDSRSPSRRIVAAACDHHLLEIAHVAVHVAAIGPQIDDRIAHQLAGAVVGDVAAASRLEDLDAG